jgi:UDP-N-acetylglucosamine 2-epimerase (non-hydrolysing)
VVHAGVEELLTGKPELVTIDRRLGIGPGTHAERTAAALIAFEAMLLEERPEIVVVAGDDDLTVAATMAAAKQHIAVAHLGAGLRGHDWTLPDEINRVLVDRLSDTLFTHSEDAAANLRAEGVPDSRIHFVGNPRVDVLRRWEPRARALAAWESYGARRHEYTFVTLQRPETFEAPGCLSRLAEPLAQVAAAGPVLLAVHPATAEPLGSEEAVRLLAGAPITTITPAGYLEWLSLLCGAGAIVTDAPTIQDDASALGVRCYSLLQRSARTSTLTHGTNVLLGTDPSAIATVSPTGCAPTPAAVPLWDGRAGERIANALAANYTLAAAFGRDH